MTESEVTSLFRDVSHKPKEVKVTCMQRWFKYVVKVAVYTG
jgi:hypothetical protein